RRRPDPARPARPLAAGRGQEKKRGAWRASAGPVEPGPNLCPEVWSWPLTSTST
ncbi:hypothetical protein HMPREF0731_0950, partial [Pseudoroseomonas cervicalis ATCC 49957]